MAFFVKYDTNVCVSSMTKLVEDSIMKFAQEQAKTSATYLSGRVRVCRIKIVAIERGLE
jgi:hypothetical protein